MAPTVSEVEDLSSTGWKQIDQQTKQNLLDMAEREANTIYGGQLATISEVEGNKDDFIANLCAHKLTLAQGGEAQSENATGGSVNYNTVTGESQDTLTETRYGRVCKMYLRQGASVSVVRGDY